MRRRNARHAWLSLTPEPERELPRAVVTLRLGVEPPSGEVARERELAERLVLHGDQRAWLAWLREALALAEAAPAGDGAAGGARALVVEVLSNHHGLALALPGDAADRTEPDRARLRALAAEASTRGPEATPSPSAILATRNGAP